MITGHEGRETKSEPSANRDFEILLAIGHEENRKILSEWLGDHYSIRKGIEPDFDGIDCIIADEPGFETHFKDIKATIEEETPVFLPVLLITQESSRVPDPVWELVDDVVQTPIQQSVLGNRLQVLFQTRVQSLELKRHQERSEERFKRLFHTAPDPVIVVEEDGTILDVNDAFLDLINSSREEVVGASITEIGFEPSETLERILLRVEEPDTPDQGTVTYLDSDGLMSVSELNADVLSYLGETTERIGMFRDITQRTQSREGLKQKVQRLDEFSSIVSHDLRNPLTIAMGNLDLAQSRCDIDELDEVQYSLERMDDLIQKLLEFARSGTLVTDPSVISLDRMSTVAKEIADKSSDVELEVDTDGKIFGDEEQVRRIFENLFRNAIEHSESPVTIRVGEVEDGFFIEDNGPGIPPAVREDVFSIGFTTDDGGSGLGLSIVKDIADAHRWTVEIADGMDGGTRFEFRNVEFST